MNPKYDVRLKVKDMGGENFQLIQNEHDIAQFNEEYHEDFSYYFIEWLDDCSGKLYGVAGLFLHNSAYFVADF